MFTNSLEIKIPTAKGLKYKIFWLEITYILHVCYWAKVVKNFSQKISKEFFADIESFLS